MLNMVFRFRRMRALDPLQVAMTGVRMGERILLIGCDDRALLDGLAAKVGLSGAMALAAGDDAEAQRGRRAAGRAGALVDIRVGSRGQLAFDADTFDMVVVDDTAGRFSALPAEVRGACLRDVRRVLRGGGRVEIIERTHRGFFGGSAVPAGAMADGPGTLTALAEAGFFPVRQLAEKDGFRFFEGLKGKSDAESAIAQP